MKVGKIIFGTDSIGIEILREDSSDDAMLAKLEQEKVSRVRKTMEDGKIIEMVVNVLKDERRDL